jgi:hypothetical protein
MNIEYNMQYFCNINKYEYAVALHIMEYKNMDDSMLLDSLTNYRIDDVPNEIIDLAQSMEMYLLFTRLGLESLEYYCNGYFLDGRPVTRSYYGNGYEEKFKLDIATEDYAKYIFTLIDEIYGFGINMTFYNREGYSLPFYQSHADRFDEYYNNEEDKMDNKMNNMTNQFGKM